MSAQRPDRNLALELVRVTEAAAMAAGRWVGRGDKNAADQAAVDAMRLLLDTVSMRGVVVIGEGGLDRRVRALGRASHQLDDLDDRHLLSSPRTDMAAPPYPAR